MTTVRAPNVFMVGAGRMAAALAGALRRGGVPVLGLWGRRADAVRQAGSVAGVATFSAAPPDLLLEADCLVLAVSDDALGEVAEMLVGTGLVTRRHVILQCAGGRPARETFAAVRARVAGVGTLHPLRSVVDPRQAMAALRGATFGVEGDEPARATALELVRILGGKPLDVDGAGMALYHAGAALASNVLVALLDAAGEAFEAAGIPRDEAVAAVLPLVQGTIDNIAAASTTQALTGPISRGDASTVTRHLEALLARAPGLVPLYRAGSRRALEIARRRGEIDESALAAIEGALAARDRTGIS